MKKASVFGAGSFGTAIATVLANNFEQVVLWGRDEQQMEALNASRENAGYLPGLKLPDNLKGSHDVESAMQGAQVVVLGTPSQATRDFLSKYSALIPKHVPIVTVAKGIEAGTLLTMTEVMEQCLDEVYHPHVAVLSGPSFAKEMVKKMPTVVTIASRYEKTAREAQACFQCESFRTYTSTDVMGVQVGGSLKNVIAIAAGMSDGLGLGHNTRAAIITRGLAEMTRIAVRMGANPLTMSGLAGMGDLVLTCTGDLSRNRTVGFELGKGKKLDDILRDMKQVAEGVKTAQSVRELATKYSVVLPICDQVYAIAYEGKSAKAAAMDLMVRSPKSELV